MKTTKLTELVNSRKLNKITKIPKMQHYKEAQGLYKNKTASARFSQTKGREKEYRAKIHIWNFKENKPIERKYWANSAKSNSNSKKSMHKHENQIYQPVQTLQ